MTPAVRQLIDDLRAPDESLSLRVTLACLLLPAGAYLATGVTADWDLAYTVALVAGLAVLSPLVRYASAWRRSRRMRAMWNLG